jgi:hypothetical protein
VRVGSSGRLWRFRLLEITRAGLEIGELGTSDEVRVGEDRMGLIPAERFRFF